jgi:hypothetical protein
LIVHGALAIEIGAVAQDVALTIHPHPTLSETVAEAAEAFLGMATDIAPRRWHGEESSQELQNGQSLPAANISSVAI